MWNHRLAFSFFSVLIHQIASRLLIFSPSFLYPCSYTLALFVIFARPFFRIALSRVAVPENCLVVQHSSPSTSIPTCYIPHIRWLGRPSSATNFMTQYPLPNHLTIRPPCDSVHLPLLFLFKLGYLLYNCFSDLARMARSTFLTILIRRCVYFQSSASSSNCTIFIHLAACVFWCTAHNIVLTLLIYPIPCSCHYVIGNI